MAANPSAEELSSAILQAVERSGYPDETVASADFPDTAYSNVIQALEKARDDVKAEIRAVSKDVAPDIDGWIAQAKQLQKDIEQSKITAQQIVKDAEEAKALQAEVDDAANQIRLLEGELALNETLTNILQHVERINGMLDEAQEMAVQEQVNAALDKIEETEQALKRLGEFESTSAVAVLRDRMGQLRGAILEDATECWSALLIVNFEERKVTIKDEILRGESPININQVVEALERLRKLQPAIERFCQDFDRLILKPRLDAPQENRTTTFDIEGDDISASGRAPDMTVHAVLSDIDGVVEYLSTRLPPSIAEPVAGVLMPLVIERLATEWFHPSVPSSVDGLHEFQEMLDQITQTAEHLGEFGWMGRTDLLDWVESAPRIWLTKRRELSLASIRTVCMRGIHDRRVVERVETETVSKHDVMVSAHQTDDDWDAWGSDGDGEVAAASQETHQQAEEDDDTSAWDTDGDDQEAKQGSVEAKAVTNDAPKQDDQDDAEAWGWDEEEADKEQAATASPPKAKKAAPTNGHKMPQKAAAREITLKETYTITAVPDGIMELIQRIVSDAEILSDPDYPESTIAPAALGLYSIPTLLLAMYRATAFTHYSRLDAGNMLIYNDVFRLCDQLRSFVRQQSEKDETSSLAPGSRPSSRLKLETDIKGLEDFAKRAYGKEMEAQRTILGDLLDGAQGFANCTVQPFADECDNAVAMTVDRVRDVNKEWKEILSRSALLQSLGSLLATVTNKVIVDIEDMSDISEEESKRLRHFCQEISKLNELFMQQHPSGEIGDMTGIYTPNWFKFQYLSEIMESSLADIKYMWNEGELQLEFDAEEIVDLIEALFAESDHRRRAITEIRRNARGN